MKIFLTEAEVIELAYDALDMHCPDPDKVHDIAKRMDMEYNEDLDMYEDVEEVALRKYRHAPDLLEALKFIVNDMEPGEDAKLTVAGYNKACSAISKATS
jgi:hypothetical protein